MAESQLKGGEVGEEVVGTHTGEVLGAARCLVGFGEAAQNGPGGPPMWGLTGHVVLRKHKER